jgi:hypothetical protein
MNVAILRYLFTEYEGSHAFFKKELDAYEVSFTETRTTNETESPLYLQILDEEAVELHKLCEIVGNVSWVKTDCAYSSK